MRANVNDTQFNFIFFDYLYDFFLIHKVVFVKDIRNQYI